MVLKGKAKVRVGAEEKVVVVLMPPNVEHEGKTREDRTVINCTDIVPGWSGYHARWEK